MKKLTLLIILFGLLTGSAFAQFIPRPATAGISTAKSILWIHANASSADTGGLVLSATQTIYASPSLAADYAAIQGLTESEAAFVIPFSATLRNLNIRTSTAVKTGSPITVFTVRKNGVDTALAVTLTETVSTTSTDSTHSVSFAAGDRLTLSVVCSGSGTSTGIASISLEVDSP